MKIELKSITENAYSSHDGPCFGATVYIDSKRVGTVSNSGQGEPNLYSPDSLRATLATIAKTLPPYEAFGMMIQPDADFIIAVLLDAEMERRHIKRSSSTRKTSK
jgi:hypothetical protein